MALPENVQANIAETAMAVVKKWASLPVRGEVTSVADPINDFTRIGVRVAGEVHPVTYQVLSSPYKPAVGDTVWGFSFEGGIVLFGRTMRSSDRMIDAVDADVTALEGSVGTLQTDMKSAKSNISDLWLFKAPLHDPAFTGVPTGRTYRFENPNHANWNRWHCNSSGELVLWQNRTGHHAVTFYPDGQAFFGHYVRFNNGAWMGGDLSTNGRTLPNFYMGWTFLAAGATLTTTHTSLGSIPKRSAGWASLNSNGNFSAPLPFLNCRVIDVTATEVKIQNSGTSNLYVSAEVWK